MSSYGMSAAEWVKQEDARRRGMSRNTLVPSAPPMQISRPVVNLMDQPIQSAPSMAPMVSMVSMAQSNDDERKLQENIARGIQMKADREKMYNERVRSSRRISL